VCAKWSPDGSKFAVGSVEGLVAVGHFDRGNDWWVCRHLKKTVDGPVLSIAWHPTASLLAIGTLAGNLTVASAFVAEINEGKEVTVGWIDSTVLRSFDTECFKIEIGSWVQGVSFSPSGHVLAWSTRSAVISLFYPASGHQSSVECLSNGCKIPLQKLLFLSENVLMAAGSSGQLMILSGADGKQWGLRQESVGGTSSSPAHTSPITSLESFEAAQQRQVGNVATLGLDGSMIIWPMAKLASQYEMEAARL